MEKIAITSIEPQPDPGVNYDTIINGTGFDQIINVSYGDVWAAAWERVSDTKILASQPNMAASSITGIGPGSEVPLYVEYPGDEHGNKLSNPSPQLFTVTRFED
jgi:hypothetical protein